MENWNSERFFAKKIWFLLQECHFFYFFPPENEFLQKFGAINAHSNEEFTLKHCEKKFYLKFVEGFSGLFCMNIT